MYDNSKAVVMKGTLTKFEWTNPHNQIYFDVTDEKGVTHWTAATEPPQVMLERGWTRKSLTIGDQVTVYVFVAKNGAPVGNLQKIVLANGNRTVGWRGRGASLAGCRRRQVPRRDGRCARPRLTATVRGAGFRSACREERRSLMRNRFTLSAWHPSRS